MDVIIVGGSLAGLCTGIVLNRLGHNVTILERNPASAMEDGGAGMSAVVFYPDLIPTLKKLGTSGNPLIDFLSTYDRTNSPYYRNVPGWISQILNRDGSVKVSKHYEWLVAAATSWDLLYNILRANFGGGHEGGFINAAPKESGDGKTEYIYGTRVTSIKEINDMVEVELVSIDGKTDSRKCNLLIGADGASSTVRRLLLPEVERTYTGYVTWRGTIERDGLSSQTVETLGDGLTQFYCKGNQVVHYPIPGHRGAVSAEKQYFNTVWYTNYAINSPEFRDLFTDTSGKPHKFSLPPDSIRPDLIAAQKEIAKKLLPPQLSEVFNKIEKPFVTAITDSFSSKARFLNGKVFLVGDAIVGLRPHTAVGSTQAALHALLLHRVFKKDPEMTVEEWEESVYGWGREAYELGLEMGNLSQFGNHPMADDS